MSQPQSRSIFTYHLSSQIEITPSSLMITAPLISSGEPSILLIRTGLTPAAKAPESPLPAPFRFWISVAIGNREQDKGRIVLFRDGNQDSKDVRNCHHISMRKSARSGQVCLYSRQIIVIITGCKLENWLGRGFKLHNIRAYVLTAALALGRSCYTPQFPTDFRLRERWFRIINERAVASSKRGIFSLVET